MVNYRVSQTALADALSHPFCGEGHHLPKGRWLDTSQENIAVHVGIRQTAVGAESALDFSNIVRDLLFRPYCTTRKNIQNRQLSELGISSTTINSTPISETRPSLREDSVEGLLSLSAFHFEFPGLTTSTGSLARAAQILTSDIPDIQSC